MIHWSSSKRHSPWNDRSCSLLFQRKNNEPQSQIWSRQACQHCENILYFINLLFSLWRRHRLRSKPNTRDSSRNSTNKFIKIMAYYLSYFYMIMLTDDDLAIAMTAAACSKLITWWISGHYKLHTLTKHVFDAKCVLARVWCAYSFRNCQEQFQVCDSKQQLRYKIIAPMRLCVIDHGM